MKKKMKTRVEMRCVRSWLGSLEGGLAGKRLELLRDRKMMTGRARSCCLKLWSRREQRQDVMNEDRF